MDTTFTPEQDALRDSVRRFTEAHADMAWVRERYHDAAGTTDEVWAGLVEMGLTSLLVPEANGGSGASVIDVGAVAEELGRAVHPGPWLSTAVTAPVLLCAAPDDDTAAALLAGIANGNEIVAVATDPLRATASAAGSGSGWRIDGKVMWVPDASASTTVVCQAIADDGPCLVAVDTASLTVEVTPTIDGSRSFGSVSADAAPGRRLAIPPEAVAPALQRALDVTRIVACADGLGAAQRALELAVDYAKVRQQFGVPIGSFQAVQHLCADMLRDVEVGRSAVLYALWAADGTDEVEAHRAASLTKAWCSDAFERVGASCIQVLAGVGFTWESDAHLYYKRLLTLQQWLGGTGEHLDALADRLLT